MKKTLILLLFAVFAAGTVPVSAQSDSDYESTPSRQRAPLRKSYLNFSFVMQDSYSPGYTSEFTDSAVGAAISYGRSYILHRRPIAGMLHIGLDVNWIDLNYARESTLVVNDKYSVHHADISLFGLGLGIHLTPVSKLGVHTYFRYLPTASTFFSDEGFYYGYASMFTSGAAVSWSTISLGAEIRWGGGTYYYVDDGDYRSQLNTLGLRSYISLRF